MTDSLIPIGGSKDGEEVCLDYPGISTCGHSKQMFPSTAIIPRFCLLYVPFMIILFSIPQISVVLLPLLVGVILFTTVFSYFFLTYNVIRLSDRAIGFPWYFHAELKRKLSVPWEEIASLSLIDSDCEFRGHRLLMQLYSDRHAEIELVKLSDEHFDSLMDYLEKVPSSKFSQPDLLSEMRKWYNYEKSSSDIYSLNKVRTSVFPNDFGLRSYKILGTGDLIGATPHTVTEALAAGGISAIYICHCSGAGHMIKEYWLGWSAEVEELVEELDALCERLSGSVCPESMQPREWFRVEDRFYILMNHFKGQTVRSRIVDGKKSNLLKIKGLSPQARKDLILDVGRQLCMLHENDPSIVHAGLDPDSVTINDSGRAFITEPPLIKTLLMRKSGSLLANLPYVAPETLAGELTPAADAYSLGKLAYYLHTGRDPELDIHYSETTGNTRDQFLIEAFRSFASVDPGERQQLSTDRLISMAKSELPGLTGRS